MRRTRQDSIKMFHIGRKQQQIQSNRRQKQTLLITSFSRIYVIRLQCSLILRINLLDLIACVTMDSVCLTSQAHEMKCFSMTGT